MHLTDAAVKRLPVPANGNRITFDDAVGGFGCRVTAGGVRSFVLDYRTKAGRQRRITIGQYPNWSTAGARQEASRLRQEIDRGADPLEDIQEARGGSRRSRSWRIGSRKNTCRVGAPVRSSFMRSRCGSTSGQSWPP